MSLETELIGQQSSRFHRIRIVDETGSTNRDLMNEALKGASEGEVLVAGHQTEGRGRQGRTWLDEPDSALLVSWLLRPEGYEVGLIPLLTGMAVVDALSELGAPVGLKWPNDVLVPSFGERKLAGILAEAGQSQVGAAEPALHVVVGLGLNLAFSGSPEAGDVAIDLASLVDASLIEAVPPKIEVLRSVLGHVERYLQQLEAGAADDVRAAYVDRCLTIGRAVRFTTPIGEVTGTATAIDDSGALTIDTSTGTVIVTAGDAHHI